MTGTLAWLHIMAQDQGFTFLGASCPFRESREFVWGLEFHFISLVRFFFLLQLGKLSITGCCLLSPVQVAKTPG